ncbi:Aldehyde/histidinol dehydrogenase [Mycena leptocephala]|nr:Aldehyde/histidinol dehydrogenase [Mycena leptocephala]
MVQENREAFADSLIKDLQKPQIETYFSEIGLVVELALISVKDLDNWAKPIAVEGTVLIIAPWNYPLVLTLQPLLDAIAAGCCAVLKPSELAPHFAELLADLLPKYLDPNTYRVVLGAVTETSKLLELRWDHIFYTGNSRIARIISAATAKHLTPLTLELGGKSPVIIDPTYDIAVAAKRILWARAQNCGQLHLAYCLPPAPRAAVRPTPVHQGSGVLGRKTEETSKIEITVIKDVLADDSFMEGEIFGPFWWYHQKINKKKRIKPAGSGTMRGSPNKTKTKQNTENLQAAGRYEARHRGDIQTS